MTTYNMADFHLKPLEIRKRLGRERWSAPRQLDWNCWAFQEKVGDGSVIVSFAEWDEPGGVMAIWVHASIAFTGHMPTYEDLKMLYETIFEGGWAYQVFAPPHRHVSYHQYALHLWGPADRQDRLPDFGREGII